MTITVRPNSAVPAYVMIERDGGLVRDDSFCVAHDEIGELIEQLEAFRPKTKTQYRYTYTSPWSDEPFVGRVYDPTVCTFDKREVPA